MTYAPSKICEKKQTKIAIFYISIADVKGREKILIKEAVSIQEL